ncbi:MAG: hypothetical protein K2M97_08215, partial [Muribaculaceae bacterium]|nr:hypothetical protein [Muribaculaceae bacterium]
GQQYAPTASVNRYITDAEGKRLIVRCSNFATWAKETIPSGTGSLVGILSYYGTDWQLLMIDANGAISF